MIYAPNTTTWSIGSLVLHDCDAKRAEYLMRVTKYLKSGKVRAEYVDPKLRREQLRRTKSLNDDGWFDLCQLHDPARFGVQIPEGGAA